MFLIVGVAGAAAAVVAWYRKIQGTDRGARVIVSMRRQSGVLAAFVNMVGSLLDALLLVRRVSAVGGGARPSLSIGRVADEDD